MKTGIELIAAERAEQIEKHGRSIGHDMFENSLEEEYLEDYMTEWYWLCGKC